MRNCGNFLPRAITPRSFTASRGPRQKNKADTKPALLLLNVFDLYFNLESPCSTLYCTNRNRRCFSLRDILRCDEYQRTNVYRIFRRVQ